MPITIYKSDVGPPSRAVLMIAELLKLNYETQDVSCVEEENMKPEYLEKNPLHTVPLLEDGEFFLADSHAIITYLVSKYGADKRAELYPIDLALRATIDQRLFFDATILFPTCRAILRDIIFHGAPGPNETQINYANEGYEILEKYLESTRFVTGDYLTLADVSIAATVSSLDVLVPIDEKYAKVHTWLSTLKDEEWYQTANTRGLSQMSEVITSILEKNSD